MQTAPVHWTTYVQTFAVIASTVGTFVYVYFTYHIMKWAVDQGRASIEVAELTLRQERERRRRTLESWLYKLRAVEHNLILWRAEYGNTQPITFSSVSSVALDRVHEVGIALSELITEAPEGHESLKYATSLLVALEESCQKARKAEDEATMTQAHAAALLQSAGLFGQLFSAQQEVSAELLGLPPVKQDNETIGRELAETLMKSDFSTDNTPSQTAPSAPPL